MTHADARDPLLDRLAEAWTRHDPPPADLTDRMLGVVQAEVAADPLEVEYELLVLTSSSDQLVGTRAGGGPITLQFEGDEVQVLVRVSPLSDDECRVDGWVTPGEELTVTAIQGERRTTGVMTAPGRFEFPALHREPTRLLLWSAGTGGAPAPLGTAPFDL